MSKAITEKRDDKPTPGSPLLRETAPSVMRDDDLVVPRWIGAIALVMTLVGGDLLLWAFTNWSVIRLLVQGIGSLFKISPTPLGTWSLLLATVFFILGLIGLIFHSSVEREPQLRRLYGLLGSLWFVAGVTLFLFQAFGAHWASHLLTPAVGCLLLGLAFFLTFIRNEKELDYRNAQSTCWAAPGPWRPWRPSGRQPLLQLPAAQRVRAGAAGPGLPVGVHRLPR